MNTTSLLRHLVLAVSLLVTGGAAESANGPADPLPTVHLVAIGDLDVGGSFGKQVAEDAKNTVSLFENAFAKAGKPKQLQPHLLLGKDVTPENVLDVISKLKVQKNDTLVVLYSGHGRMMPDLEHHLTFEHGTLARKELLKAMKAKGPRLMVLLTDCCSAGIDAESRCRIRHR